MDKCSDTIQNADDKMSQYKSLTPAVLGIPSGPHGTKLSSNMNLKDKEKLLLNLQAWREARKEKLIATILAKGKQSSCSKLTPVLPKPKAKPVGIDPKMNLSDRKKNVFDRLYENANKVATRKVEEKKEQCNATKNVPAVKPKHQFGKHKVPKVIVCNDSVNSSGSADETCEETTMSVDDIKSVLKKEHMIEDERNDSGNHSKETTRENNLVHVVSEVKVTAESHGSDNNSELPQEIDLSKIKEEHSKEQDDVSVQSVARKSNDGAKESLPETDLPAVTEETIIDKIDEFETKSNEPKKDDGGVGFDVKKSVCFETPKDKILSAVHLRNELTDWLTEKGHSIDTYAHLRCFGLNREKTPISHHRHIKIDDVSNSSFYSTAPNTPASEVDESDKENITPTVPAPRIDIKDVEGWLGDLYHLIVHVEYPSDRCEEWLNAITKKFPSCTQIPLYWECVAAMNREDDHLKRIEGNDESGKRQGEDHETSIAELLDKLVIDEKCHSASKTERGLSMKNIFKSKTVKFALQEKSVKEVDPELGTEARRKVLFATPVRRSARLQTPDKVNKSNVVGSLHSLDPDKRRSVCFQPNEALFSG